VNKEKMKRYVDDKRHARKSLINYRPVSILTTLSKVFEKVIHDHVYGNIRLLIKIGDSVLFKQRRENNLTPYYDPGPYKVI